MEVLYCSKMQNEHNLNVEKCTAMTPIQDLNCYKQEYKTAFGTNN